MVSMVPLVLTSISMGFPVAQAIKNLPEMQETQVRSLGREGPLEKWMATNSSVLAWKIPWTEEPSRLKSMGSPRVGHDWVTDTFKINFSGQAHRSYPRTVPEKNFQMQRDPFIFSALIWGSWDGLSVKRWGWEEMQSQGFKAGRA